MKLSVVLFLLILGVGGWLVPTAYAFQSDTILDTVPANSDQTSILTFLIVGLVCFLAGLVVSAALLNWREKNKHLKYIIETHNTELSRLRREANRARKLPPLPVGYVGNGYITSIQDQEPRVAEWPSVEPDNNTSNIPY